MTRSLRQLLLAMGSVVVFSTPAAGATPVADSLTHDLSAAAPALDAEVLGKAVSAMHCAVSHGMEPAQSLAVIDFSLPSSERRLWIFNLDERSLVVEDLVAHGRHSGDNYASSFSNVRGSNQSSLGLFRTQESYFGKYGYSLRMDGLEPGINDRARERAIVIHPADYVDPDWIERQGRIGRSFGCPAVRHEISDTVVDALKDGQFMFSYYPDETWLKQSAFLNCQPDRVAQALAPFTQPGS